MINDVKNSKDQPHDRLTSICDDVTRNLDELPDSDREGLRAILFVSDDERSGIKLWNYEDEKEAIAELLVHIQAIFQSIGKRMEVFAVPKKGQG